MTYETKHQTYGKRRTAAYSILKELAKANGYKVGKLIEAIKANEVVLIAKKAPNH